MLDRLRSYAGRRYVQPTLFAWVYAALGEKDNAFGCLRQAVEDRAMALIYLRFDSMLDTLRSDPRFAALVRDVGFPATEITAED